MSRINLAAAVVVVTMTAFAVAHSLHGKPVRSTPPAEQSVIGGATATVGPDTPSDASLWPADPETLVLRNFN